MQSLGNGSVSCYPGPALPDLKVTWKKSLGFFVMIQTGLESFCCSAHRVTNLNWPKTADSVGEGAVPDTVDTSILETAAQPLLVVKSIIQSM